MLEINVKELKDFVMKSIKYNAEEEEIILDAINDFLKSKTK